MGNNKENVQNDVNKVTNNTENTQESTIKEIFYSVDNINEILALLDQLTVKGMSNSEILFKVGYLLKQGKPKE